MGAPNFKVTNASKHFVIHGKDVIDWELREIELSEALESRFGVDYYLDGDWDNDRSYPGRTVGHIRKYLGGKFSDFGIDIKVIIRSGYYTGATLDWEAAYVGQTQIELEELGWYNGYEIMEEDIFEYLECDYNPGLVKIFRKQIYDRIIQLLHNTVKDLESVFCHVSTMYKRTGIASNGEAFYEKV